MQVPCLKFDMLQIAISFEFFLSRIIAIVEQLFHSRII